jgi:hypothetical protein
MKSWRSNGLLLAGAALLLVAIPALSQNREAPESLLPPGFGDPKALPPPEEKAPPTSPRPVPGLPTTRPPTAESPALQETGDLEEEALDPLEAPRPTNYFSIPEGTDRPSILPACSSRAISVSAMAPSAMPTAPISPH